MFNLADEFTILQGELAAEEQRGTANGISEIALRKEKREGIERRLASLERDVRRLRQRLRRLPAIPNLACVRWAQSVLAYPNCCILTVDTVSSGQDAQIIHVLLLDFNGTLRLSRCIATASTLSKQEVRALGITAQDLREASSLPQVWPSLLEGLKGRFIVSYDLKRTRQTLERGAEEYELEPPAPGHHR